MIGFVVTKLVALGLGERRAAALAPWVAVATAFALLAALWAISWPVRAIIDRFNDNEAVLADRRDANIKQLEAQVQADTTAAETRVADAVTQSEQEQDYAQAIDNPPPGASTDPGVRLACERLRRAGKDISQLPACG